MLISHNSNNNLECYPPKNKYKQTKLQCYPLIDSRFCNLFQSFPYNVSIEKHNI